MLITCTWLPPSWVAMLPQKFSAATMSTLPAPVLAVAEAPHAVVSRVTAQDIPAKAATTLERLLRMVVMTGRPYGDWAPQVKGMGIKTKNRVP
jgi:hypothetical protein